MKPIIIIVLVFTFLFAPIIVFAQTSESTNKSSLNQTDIDFYKNNHCVNELKPTDLPHSFTGTGKVHSICSTFESHSILVFVDIFEDDQIKITLPKKILSDLGICNSDARATYLLVLLDNGEITLTPITKKMDHDLVINMTKGTHVIEIIGYDDFDHPTFKCLSPKIQQEKFGPNHVECQDDLIRIKKISDGSIACVKPETAMTLIERGWEEKNESKIWVVKLDTKLAGPWNHPEKTNYMDHPVDQILFYYEKQNIKIHDIIIRIFDQPGLFTLCESLGGCPPVADLFLLVDESDVEYMLSSGFDIVEGNDTKQIGLYSCNIDVLNQSMPIDNNCSRYGKPIISFFQQTENLK